MGRHHNKKHSDSVDQKKRFFTTYTVTTKTGSKTSGVFGFDTFRANRAPTDAAQQSDVIRTSLPSDDYRVDTVRLSNQIYRKKSQAMNAIGAYNNENFDDRLVVMV